MRRMPQIEPDEIGEKAEREAVAQLAIVRVLKPLGADQRQRVIHALWHIHEADVLVPGIFEVMVQAFVRGTSPDVEPGEASSPDRSKPNEVSSRKGRLK